MSFQDFEELSRQPSGKFFSCIIRFTINSVKYASEMLNEIHYFQ